MHPQQSARIDLGDLKAQLVKRIGPEKAKRYFFYLNRFLSQKLSKNEFDGVCIRTVGKENIPLHNQLIRAILKNACQAKTPPLIPEVGPTKSLLQAAKRSPPIEDGHEQSGSLFPNQNQNQNVPIWSNGVLPVSPRKVRSGIRDRKFRDRPSPLGPNGKVESFSQQPIGAEDGTNNKLKNGGLAPCDYRRPTQHLQTAVEQRLKEIPRLAGKDRAQIVVEDLEEIGRDSRFNFSRTALLAPLGIPTCSASVGGGRKGLPLGDFVSNYDSGGLYDTETIKKRMEQIAAAQGLGGVTMDCANILNNMLDVYLKRLIKSSVELVGARSDHHESRKNTVHKQQQAHGKIINGMWPTNHIPMQASSSGPVELMQEQRSRSSSISLLDFKVAMELNPQQLGEDWPLLLERICMQAFEQ